MTSEFWIRRLLLIFRFSISKGFNFFMMHAVTIYLHLQRTMHSVSVYARVVYTNMYRLRGDLKSVVC